MIRPFLYKTLLATVFITLTACGGGGGGGSFVISESDNSDQSPGDSNPGDSNIPGNTATPETGSASLAIGKSNFEGNCAECHGNTGNSIFRPIDPDNCLVADCGSLDALASFIDMYMPSGRAHECTLGGEDSCAITTAAFIMNGFSIETGNDGPVEQIPSEPVDENVQSPLARLTNDEYVNSVRTLLSLPADSAGIEEAKNSLVSESSVRGLSNDAVTQFTTQLTLSGYSTLAVAATNDFLRDTTSKADIDQLLNCSVLLENIDASAPTRECVQEFSKGLVSAAYRRPSNSTDAENISEIYDSIITINEDAGNRPYNFAAHKATIQGIIQYIMLSPEFIFVVERGETGPFDTNATEQQLSQYEIATRMALFLGGTLPDEQLRADADAGLLTDVEVRLEHADRMMDSETGRAQFTKLVRTWLGVDEAIAGSTEVEVVNAFIEAWFLNEGSFSELYQSPVKVKHVSGIETTEPMGVLGLRGFIASHTLAPTPSFITRGVFVVEQLLCEALPDDIPDDALDAGALTPLQVFEEHAKQSCATCHKVFDNYGAAFQQFDSETSLFDPASQDFGTSFDLFDIGDVTQTVSTLDDLSFSLGASTRASNCMAELWYRHSLRRNIDLNGKDDWELQQLMSDWNESDEKSMKALLRSIVASEFFITLYL